MKNHCFLFIFLMLSGSVFSQLIINEVLYDPSNTDLEGDANGDGIYHQEHDSFIEFYNTGETNFDFSNYEIWDDEATGAPMYVIPEGTLIPPMGALVVFGGNTPTGTFGGAVILVIENGEDGMNLNNSDEIILIKNGAGETVLTFDSDALSNNPNESYTRNPDITGEFEQHSENTTLLFSPGTAIDGSSFNTVFVVSEIMVQGAGGVSEITTDDGTLQMEAQVLPAVADNTDITWSVPVGNGVAIIDANGLLTAIDNGTVTVTATAQDGSNVSGSADITISNQVTLVPVTEIIVSSESGLSEITTSGGTLQMVATVLPENADNNTVTWSVPASNSVAMIDANGLLTAIGDGTVTVTATANDASGVSGSADINVSNQSVGTSDITSRPEIELYPNPASEQITIRHEGTAGTLEIYNLTGQLVKITSLRNQTVDISDLQPAYYIIRLQSDGKWLQGSFVKY